MKWVSQRRQKLIEFLQDRLDTPVSGKRLKKILEARLCRVNGKVERFSSVEIDRGMVVELSPEWNSLEDTSRLYSTVYDDEFFLVISKPPGFICNDETVRRCFGPNHHLAHRLDKETTGVLLIGKGKAATERLQQLFFDRAIEKKYLAIVDKRVEKEEGFQKSYFAKIGSYEGQTIWGSRSRGMVAETAWKRLSYRDDASLLLCMPHTGRTHQIRVHLAEMGHPILVDPQYSRSFQCRKFFKRPLLHASKLNFIHPFTEEKIEIEAPIPQDFEDALKSLALHQS